MKRIFSLPARLRRFGGDCRGATAVEYGFILALIVLTMFVSFTEMAGTTVGMWTNTANKVAKAR